MYRGAGEQLRRSVELKPRLSIIIPTLDEGAIIERLLLELQEARAAGHEVILVDGGSLDGTPQRAAPEVDLLLRSEAGRARQMNRGAEASHGDWLWFLHADSRLPEGWLAELEAVMACDDHDWGFFRVRLDNPRWPYRMVGRFMNLRSELTAIATGDQAIFIRRTLFFAGHCFPLLPLMEDIALSRRLKGYRPKIVKRPVTTSARRWERDGVVRTILRMWGLRLVFWLGISPSRFAHRYRPCSSPDTES